MQNKIFKKNTTGQFIMAAALVIMLIFILIVASSQNRKNKLAFDATTDAARENIAVELKEYFGQYLTNQKGEIKELTNTVETMQDTGSMTVELTAEQQEKLIAGVLDNLTPDRVMELANANNEASANAIMALEQSIYDRLVENFSTYYEEGKLTDAQIEAISDAVTVIVEKNIYDELEERFSANEKYLAQIEASITEKLNKVTNTVNNYQQTVKELETKIKVTEKDSASIEEVEQLKEQLLSLHNSFQSFIATAQPAIHIVTDLSVKPTGDNDVLSAQAGYSLNRRFSDLNQTLTESYARFTEDLTNTVESNDKKQSKKLADTKSELESQIADNASKVEQMNKAREAAEKALETKSKEDIQALEDALKNLGDNVSEDLKNAYEALLAADETNMDQVEAALSTTKDTLNDDIASANNNITSLRTDLNDTKEDLTNQINQMGNDVNNNIVSKLPTYTWSSDGTHLSISIPPQ